MTIYYYIKRYIDVVEESTQRENRSYKERIRTSLITKFFQFEESHLATKKEPLPIQIYYNSSCCLVCFVELNL